MNQFYLVGQITANPETRRWREYLCNRFADYDDQILLIDPCDHIFTTKTLSEAKDGNFRTSTSFNATSAVLPVRDAQYVMKSTGCIANLNWYSPETPLLGTFFELAWYKMQPWKTVIGIYSGDPKQDYICGHPFIQSTVHVWVYNEVQVGDIIEELFL